LSAIIGATDTAWLKPQPEFTHHALACSTPSGHRAPRRRLAYDVQAAHAAGLPCWAVTTGTHNAEELRAARADEVFADLRETAIALGVA